MTNSERFVKGIADFGNLFLVLTLPGMRREGINYLALYALQKAVAAENSGYSGWSESELRDETGLLDYEVSRACRFLVKSDLLKASRSSEDKRRKILVPTARGKKVLTRILSGAAERLHDSIQEVGRFRRLQGAVEHLRKARNKLHGSFQLSFFERELQRGKRPKSSRTTQTGCEPKHPIGCSLVWTPYRETSRAASAAGRHVSASG